MAILMAMTHSSGSYFRSIWPYCCNLSCCNTTPDLSSKSTHVTLSGSFTPLICLPLRRLPQKCETHCPDSVQNFSQIHLAVLEEMHPKQTDTQTDTNTNRQTDTHTNTHIDTNTHTQTDRYTHKQTGRYTHKQTDTQTDTNTDRQTHRQIQTQTDRQIRTQTDRHTDRYKHKQTDTHTNNKLSIPALP